MPLPESARLELEAIDAALAGDAVDPRHADLAELALLLRAGRPELEPDRALSLDRRIDALAPAPEPVRPGRRPWFLRPASRGILTAGGAGLALVMILALLVIVLPRGGGPSSNGALSGSSGGVSSSSSSSSSSSGSASSSASSGVTPAGPAQAPFANPHSALSGGSGTTAAGNLFSKHTASSAAGATASPAAHAPAVPSARGRKVVQSARLALTAPRFRISTVAHELFTAVGAVRGIVKHSQVQSTGYASFTLSIPESRLSGALAHLGSLRYARVSSSSAVSNDVTNRYQDEQRALRDAEALHSTLLGQLAAATTTSEIDTLKTQIARVERTISRDESRLNTVSGRIAHSTVSVTIVASHPTRPVPATDGGGFGISRAAHDALDVLRVVAGVLIVALAVLIPLGLILGAGLWLARGRRRRERERALDGA